MQEGLPGGTKHPCKISELVGTYMHTAHFYVIRVRAKQPCAGKIFAGVLCEIEAVRAKLRIFEFLVTQVLTFYFLHF